jgi:putative holliday junction resolvase
MRRSSSSRGSRTSDEPRNAGSRPPLGGASDWDCYACAGMRRLGVDPGQRRVGLAVSDDHGEFASPHKTLLRVSDVELVRELAEEARALGVGEVVMGLPLRMSGEAGPEAKRAERLARALERVSGLPVVLWDERLTTVGAERQLRGSGLRGEKKKALIDQAAATLLLQSYLDARRERDAF